MNPLLILLGTKYRLNVEYDCYDGYKVRVSRDDHFITRSFNAFAAEVANHDVFLFTVEQCIMDLQDWLDDKNEVAKERARIKQLLNRHFGIPVDNTEETES